MKIALFSDIHANLPALEACFADMDKRKPDAIYCLGDLVGYNIWPNEVVNEIRRRGIPSIAGNYDEGIGNNSDECGCAYKTDEEKGMGKVSISYTNSVIGDEERNYLKNLPRHIKLEFRFGQRAVNLLMVHGSPRRINEYLFEDRDEKSLARIMTDAGADIMCFGHTHKPWYKSIKADHSLHAINLGSVGKPKDHDPRGCYVMLEINEDLSSSDGYKLHVEFIRFGYDTEKAALAVQQSVLPDAYAEMLRHGV
jgi:putative phosphoesterase